MIITGIEADARVGHAAISSSNLSRAALSGITVSSLDVGKRVSIGGVGPGGATLQTTITNVPNGSTIDLANAATSASGSAETVLGTDNAAVIQNAIDNNVEVEIPSGWIGCGALNLTGSRAGVLSGVGAPFSAGTWLHPFCDIGTFLDCYGRGSLILERFTFGYNGNPNRPDCGLLVGGPVDHISIDLVCGTGAYRKAAFAPVSGGLGSITRSPFWNFGTGFAWAWDLDNSRGFSSHVSIGGPYALSPWNVTRSEAHAGASSANAMLIRGADDVTWTSCIISGTPGQAGIIRVENPSVQDGMRRHVFIGNRLEGEGGAIQNIFDMQGNGSALFDRRTNMYGCTGAIVIGPGTATFEGLPPY